VTVHDSIICHVVDSSQHKTMLMVWFMMFNATFIVSLIGGGNRSARRKSQTCRKSLTNSIT